MKAALLPDRGVVKVAGEDARDFLHGLVSADVLKLASGQTLELAKAAGEPLDIFVNGRLLGRGEAVVAGDRYGVRITEIVASPADEGRS